MWYSHFFKNFPQFVVIYTVKGFGIVNKAEVGVFLELSCFFYDPVGVGNLMSGSSVFSKSSLNIWKFTVHILLKPGLENFAYYFASMCDECNCVVVWTFFGSIPSFFLEFFLHWSPIAYWASTSLGSSSFSALSFCLFIQFMRLSGQEYWSSLPFLSPVDHILSDLSTMTHLSWMAPNSLA